MIKARSFRPCPIRDAHQVIDKGAVVVGPADPSDEEALYMRAYTHNVTMLATGAAIELDAGTGELTERA
jgi:thioredoxin reductase (NADPH)